MSEEIVLIPFLIESTPFGVLRGTFATADGDYKPIKVAPLGHVERQKWVARPSGRGVTIVNADGTDELGWTFTKPGEPVTLSKNPSHWEIVVKRGPDGVIEPVKIRAIPDKEIVGATWYADTKDKEVVLTSIPVIPDAPKPPVWAFIS